MDPGWQFIKKDVSGAEATAFDDSTWDPVSTPHTYNDVDSFRVYNDHNVGDTGTYQGPAWYRKHFKIPSDYSGNKVILEFERIKQGAKFYINGSAVGVFDDGITACGVDVTGKVNFGDTGNVLAVRVDNSGTYTESTTNTAFQWMGRAFNPNYGGLIGHVWLHLPNKIYQTYPLYNNLKTSGLYIYGNNYTNLTPSKGDLTVNVESEVSNESGAAQVATLGVKVIDVASGTTVDTLQGTATSLPTTGTTVLKASGPFAGANLWSDVTPNLYDVVTTLSVGGKEVNARTTRTGFRKAEFRGGAGTGGVYINGRFVFLFGYAQRATNEWAGLGQAVPDWMHDYHTNLIKGANSNYIRWMHIAPQRIDVASNDKYGVVNVAPAGDRENDVSGVQWTQRLNVMRATMIYLRNNPSVFFWEVGNSGVSAAHMKDMADIQTQWDPTDKGGRGLGDRSLNDSGGVQYSQWFGTMLGQPYSDTYRDKGPIIECEDFRDEGMRGIWDDYTPPHVGGFKPGPLDTYHWQSESFIVGDSNAGGQVARIDNWLNINNIKNTSSANSRYSAYGSIYFSDSNADGRLQSSSVARCSGKVDAVRLIKEIYYAFRVAGNTQPDIHIIGHWNYPATMKSKTVYVLANTPSVELFVNGTSQGRSSKPADTYTFSFPGVAWSAGSIKAVGYDASAKQVCQHELKTAGPAVAIKLTPTVGPGGLRADGADVAMFDFEVVDANGQRVPDDEARVDFTMTGPGIWRGGYNTAVLGSTNNKFLNTEAGINRVFVRSTLIPGDITVTATRTGLTSAPATVTSKAVPVVNGLL
jgi:beta-galactosidase